MKKFNVIALALLAVFLSTASAYSIPASRQGTPPWVLKDASYDLDFANNREWGIAIWRGTTNSSQYRASLFGYTNSGSSADHFYTQWRDGIVRASERSSQSFVSRVSDWGLWIEGGPNGATNYILQNRDLTNATNWTLSNTSATKTSVVGADGTTGNATRVTATANNGTVLQTITGVTGKIDTKNLTGHVIVTPGTGYTNGNTLTLVGGTCGTAPTVTVSVSGGAVTGVTGSTAGSCTVLPSNPVAVTGGSGAGFTFNPAWRQATTSAWLKRNTGTGTVSLTMDNGGTWTDVTSCIGASNGNFLQCRIPTQNLINNTVGIQLGTSGDKVDVDFFQTEDDTAATSPILNTTTATARGAEDISIGTSPQQSAGWDMINRTQVNTPYAYVFWFSGNFSSIKTQGLFMTDLPLLISAAPGTNQMNVQITGGGSSCTTSNTDTPGLFTLNKLVVSISKAGSKMCMNGVKTTCATPNPVATTSGGTHGNFLNNGVNATPMYGYMARFAAFQRELTDDECLTYSTVTDNQ